ncbi:MAG: hypothetical protein O2815_05975 [Actinomycetota bacterium]|nr:hypothetical protein [Actinomycetota bacterium]
MNDTPKVRIIRSDSHRPALPLVEGEGDARAIIWPGMGATLRSVHQIVLGGGSATIEQSHPGEAVYFLKAGSAHVDDLDTSSSHSLTVGSMIHIDGGTRYRFVAGASGAEFVGGPCPPDPALYEHLQQETTTAG